MTTSSMDSSPSLSDIRFLGEGLSRPECVLATGSGALYAADWTHGVARIAPDGSVSPAVGPEMIAQGFLPNGIALMRDGDFLFANLGEAGGVWRVARKGAPEPFLIEIDGRRVPPVNFVLLDDFGRIWVTVSAATRGHKHFSAGTEEGYIALIDKRGSRIVADGLVWTNELRVSPDGRFLYVNETFACRTTRFEIQSDSSLTKRTTIDYPFATFPDGMAFSDDGSLWVICVVTNRLVCVEPDGSFRIILEDFDAAHFDRVRAAYGRDELTRDLIVDARGRVLNNLSSLAFGGRDRRTLFMGSLTASRVACLDAPVAGQRPVHWDWD